MLVHSLELGMISQKKQIDASVAVSIFAQYQINVAQYCLFDGANKDYVAYKQCNVQLLVSVDTLRSHFGLQVPMCYQPEIWTLGAFLMM